MAGLFDTQFTEHLPRARLCVGSVQGKALSPKGAVWLGMKTKIIEQIDDLNIAKSHLLGVRHMPGPAQPFSHYFIECPQYSHGLVFIIPIL